MRSRQGSIPGTLHEALTPCPQEDTSASTGSAYPMRDVDGTSPLRFPANNCDDAEHASSVPLNARPACDRSYDESPAPVAGSRSVNFEHHVEDGDEILLPDDDSPVLGSASPSLDTPSDQSAWRLPVRVPCFQTTQYYSSLWVEPGEDIDEIMIRAEADVSTCLEVDSAESIATEVATEAGLLSDAFLAHGMRLCFGPLKTAAMVAVRGPGSKAVRSKLFTSAKLCVMRENAEPEHLPLVHRYKHVGVTHDPQGALTCELKQRAGEAWQAFRQGRKKLFRNGAVAVKARIALLRSLVMSKFLYAAGAWPALKVGEGRLFKATTLAFYRSVAGPRRQDGQHLYQCEVCARAEPPAPWATLHAERLRNLRQMVAAGPDVLWGLVKADERSSAPLKEALCWLHVRVHSPGPLKHPSEAWPDWEALSVQRPKCFKAMVKRALSLDALRQRCLAALCRLHKQLTALHGVDLTEAEGLALSDAVEACPVCRLAFESRVAWAAHASRLHGYRIPATAIAAGRTCRACGKTYATPGRLHRHLQATPACCAGWGRFRLRDA